MYSFQHILIFFGLAIVYSAAIAQDTLSTTATPPKKTQTIIKIHEQVFENDFIKFRRFGYPYLSMERDLKNNVSLIVALKYNYYNYKNDTYFPTNNFYQYYGIINQKTTLEIGLRWYLLPDATKNFGNGLFLTTLSSVGLSKSASDFSNNTFKYIVPSFGLGLGYQYFITSKISCELEVLFKKGIKFIYLNGETYRQADINYNNLGIRLGFGYKFPTKNVSQ